MSFKLIVAACIILVTLAILVLISYLVMLLSHLKKMLKPVDNMLNELNNEFRPLMKDMSGISSSINNIFGRIDRITSLVFGKVDMMAKASEKASSYVQQFIKNPRVELQSISAGIKRGIEILFKKKGE